MTSSIRSNRTALLTGLWVALATALIPTAVQAQAFPVKPVRIVVTFPPGGGTDVVARLLGAELTATLGQNVVVENRAGATGTIGTDFVAKSAADGYTLLMVNSTHAINASVFPKLPFDTVNDFVGVIAVATVPAFVAVSPNFPAKNIAELIALLKSNPSKYAYASCGSGSPQHLAAELFKVMTKTEMTHVPYKGCAPALADVLGAQVPISFNTAANTVPHVTSGRLRAIATTGKRRFPLAPDVPTMAEAGLTGYDVEQWFGLLAPAKTPREIVQRLNGAVAEIVGRKAVQDRMSTLGFAPMTSTPEQFNDTVRADVERWGKLARSIGLKAD